VSTKRKITGELKHNAHNEVREGSQYVRNRCCGRTRSRRLADLRCCREVTSETSRQRSTKYCGAWPCKQLCTMMQSLYVTHSDTSNQCSLVCSNWDRPCVCRWLRAAVFTAPWNLSVVTFPATRQKSVTVVNTWRHEWVDECRCWLCVEWMTAMTQLPKPVEAWGADDGDVLIKAKIGRDCYSQQPDMAVSYNTVVIKMQFWQTKVVLVKTVSLSDPQ